MNKNHSLIWPKNFSWFFSDLRVLMKQLIRVQNENLAMQRQRFNLERQRLEVEKNLGNQIVNLLAALQQTVSSAASPSQSRSSYRLRRERRANNHSSDDEEQDWNLIHPQKTQSLLA